jgi:hypothetical protein
MPQPPRLHVPADPADSPSIPLPDRSTPRDNVGPRLPRSTPEGEGAQPAAVSPFAYAPNVIVGGIPTDVLRGDLKANALPVPDMTAIYESLRVLNGVDAQRVAVFGLALVTKLLAKNADYGSTAFERPALASDVPVRKALMVRASDKVGRIANLAKSDKPAHLVDESIAETVGDLAGYAVLYLAAGE